MRLDIFFISVLLAISCSYAQESDPPMPTPLTGARKVMLAGDSNTKGAQTPQDASRLELDRLLGIQSPRVTNWPTITWVGTNNTGTVPVNNHEGWPNTGITDHMLGGVNSVPALLSGAFSDTDVVSLNIGRVDADSAILTAAFQTNLQLFAAQCLAVKPDLRFVFWTIPITENSTAQARINTINAALPATWAAMATSGVVFETVDQSNITLADLIASEAPNRIHLNWDGDNKAAADAAGAFTRVLGFSVPQPLSGTTYSLVVLGDDLVYGTGDPNLNGFRLSLDQEMRRNYPQTTFSWTGPQVTGSAPASHHSGFQNAKTTDFTAIIPTTFGAGTPFTPDAFLINVGLRDVIANPATFSANYTTMMAALKTAVPSAKYLITELVQAGTVAQNQNIDVANGQLSTLLDTLEGSGYVIQRIAPPPRTYEPVDYQAGANPLNLGPPGFEKMAGAFAPKLVTLLGL